MKKLSLLFISLLSLCACEKSTSKNSGYVESGKYKSVKNYSYVQYRFDNQMRCVVHYDHYTNNEESGYVIAYSKDWCVYLKGYYYKYRPYSTEDVAVFYECQYSTGSYDYYLTVNL